jgi:hypothetical protein
MSSAFIALHLELGFHAVVRVKLHWRLIVRIMNKYKFSLHWAVWTLYFTMTRSFWKSIFFRYRWYVILSWLGHQSLSCVGHPVHAAEHESRFTSWLRGPDAESAVELFKMQNSCGCFYNLFLIWNRSSEQQNCSRNSLIVLLNFYIQQFTSHRTLILVDGCCVSYTFSEQIIKSRNTVE